MVIDESGRLHEGIADRGADKLESPTLQIITNGIGERCSRRQIVLIAETIDDRLPLHEGPEIFVETPPLLLHSEEGFSIRDRGLNFQSIADDLLILNQSLDLARAEARHLLGIEVGKGFGKTLALVEHDSPRESGLEGVEDHELEKLALIMKRHPPLGVVISNHQGVNPRPSTTG